MDEHNVNKALQNHLILERIFVQLSFTDLLSCRLVCRKWATVSISHLVESSVLGISSYYEEGWRDRRLENFIADFPCSSPIHYKRLQFEGTFKAAELEIFFQDRPFIKELTLGDVKIECINNLNLNYYDLSAWNNLHLTSLNICLMGDGDKELLLPLKFLGAIQKLSLFCVTVELDGLITPTTVSCECVTYMENGRKLESRDRLDLLAYIDACNLKELKILCCWPKAPEFHLDLTQCPRLEDLQMNTKHVVGWSDRLILKKLRIEGYEDRGRLAQKLASTPSLQELDVYFYGDGFSKKDPFENIKCLTWVCTDEGSNPPISAFPNVIRMEIYRFVRLKLNTFPTSLKVIQIDTCNAAKWKFKGKAAFQLDKLIIQVHAPVAVIVRNVSAALGRMNIGSVVLNIENPNVSRNDLVLAFQEIAKCRILVLGRRCNADGEKLTTNDVNDCSSLLSQLLEMQSDYIICEGGCVREISKTEFEVWVKGY